jgi:hypothetical protein
VGLQELAAKLAGVLQPYTAGKGGPEAADRCARCILLLQSVADAPLPPAPPAAADPSEAAENGNADAGVDGAPEDAVTPVAAVGNGGGAAGDVTPVTVSDNKLVVPPEMRVTARCVG